MTTVGKKIANIKGKKGDSIRNPRKVGDNIIVDRVVVDQLTGAETVTEVDLGNFRGAAGSGTEEFESADVLFSVTDHGGAASDLTVRNSDGQFASFVIDRLKARLDGRIRVESPTLDIAGGVVRVLNTQTGKRELPAADYTRASIWGSSTINGLAPEFDLALRPFGITTQRGGRGGEVGEQTAARIGSIPARVSAFTIPASGVASVTVPGFPSSNGGTDIVGTLAGIAGTLSQPAGGGSAFTFTRTNAGMTRAVASGTPMIPAYDPRGGITIINDSKNNFTGVGGNPSVDAAIDRLRTTLAWLETGNWFVWGHFVDTGVGPTADSRKRIEEYNRRVQELCGARYFDLGAYLYSEQVWTDTGITPTSADLLAQADRNKAPSLSSDSLHINEATENAVVNKFVAQLQALNWIGV